MDLVGYLRALRKSWWVVALAAVLGVGGGIVYNENASPLYASSVTFYVSASPTGANASTLQANQLAQDKIASYALLMTSDLLGRMVVEKSGVSMDPQDVANRITTNSPLNTTLLTATVVDGSSTRSLAIATALASEFGVLIDQVDNNTATGNQSAVIEVHVVSGPDLNPFPVSPRVRLNLALGAVLGLALGVILALLRAILDMSVRDVETLRRVTGQAVLGLFGADTRAHRNPVLTGDQMQSVRAESFRQLRTNLQFIDADNPVQVLVVTSSVSGEGKSTTAVNLAAVYAEAGRRVLLIEADMRRGRLGEYLGLEASVGLSNVVVGAAEAKDVIQSWSPDGFAVLPGGVAPPNPSELLGSQRMVHLIDELRESYDQIIVDCPPLLPVTDAAIASTWSDGVLMVVRHGRTSQSRIQASLAALEAVDARVLGVVLSMSPSRGGSRGDLGYSAYSYGDVEPRPWWQFWRKPFSSKERSASGKKPTSGSNASK